MKMGTFVCKNDDVYSIAVSIRALFLVAEDEDAVELPLLEV